MKSKKGNRMLIGILFFAIVMTYMPLSQVHRVKAANISDFINDGRWCNGISWGEGQGPKLSSWSSSGCCAYVCDFVKYVYGHNSYKDGATTFTSVNEIREGDVIHTGDHYFAVLGRNGNQLYTAEGNMGGKVCISNTRYSISGSEISYTSASGPATYRIVTGYHHINQSSGNNSIGSIDEELEANTKLTVGDTAYFGLYIQKEVTDEEVIKTLKSSDFTDNKLYMHGIHFAKKDGKYYQETPIEWQVLADEGNCYMMLSKKILCIRDFGGEVFWDSSDIRTWLNEDFYNEAFSTDEKNSILTTMLNTLNWPYEDRYINGIDAHYETTQDKVYLLDYDDVQNTSYGFVANVNESEARVAYATQYADYNESAVRWWLRGPSQWSYGNLQERYVTAKGELWSWYGTYSYGVRPVIRVEKAAVSVIEPEIKFDEWNQSENTSVPTGTSIQTQETDEKDITTENNIITIKKPSKPGKVKLTSCKSKSKKNIKIRWKKVSGSDGYQVQWSRKRSFSSKRTSYTYGQTKVLDYGLKSKKKYYVRVRAYKDGNRANDYQYVYGSWSKVKVVKVK